MLIQKTQHDSNRPRPRLLVSDMHHTPSIISKQIKNIALGAFRFFETIDSNNSSDLNPIISSAYVLFDGFFPVCHKAMCVYIFSTNMFISTS